MPKTRSKTGLTAKESAFIQDYSQTLNASESANKVYDCNNKNTALIQRMNYA